MSGPFKRRPSLKKLPALGLVKNAGTRRRSSLALQPIPLSHNEIPWDLIDRLVPCLLFCHASAALISNFLALTRIVQITTFSLFIWFTIFGLGITLFYHHLKVTLVGKAVLITGCDSRIGTALARLFDELGLTVFAGFQNADCPQAEELKEESSGRLHLLQLDVSSEAQILAASLYAVKHLPDDAPGLWALIHASSWIALGEIEWVPPQVFKKAAEVNLIGATRLIQVMLPLVRRARGRVIIMTSGLSKIASPVRGVHCALLQALETEAGCLRKELKPRGVNVIVVAAGDYSVGNSWLSDEMIRDQARDIWQQLGQEQKSEYGEEHFEAAMRSLEKFSKNPDADVSPVVRMLTDAVIRAFPLARYTPLTRQEKLQAFIADHCPRVLYDIIY